MNSKPKYKKHYRSSSKSYSTFSNLETETTKTLLTFTNIKVGSKLIQGNCVYEVFDITKSDKSESSERLIHYRPYFRNDNNASLTCTVPESNLNISNFRHPSTKKDIDELFLYLAIKIKHKKELDPEKVNMLLKQNNLRKIAFVIKKLTKEMDGKVTLFPKIKRDLMNTALNIICEEIAAVTHKTPENARKSVLQKIGAK